MRLRKMIPLPAELTVDDHLTEVTVKYPDDIDICHPEDLKVFYKGQEITSVIPNKTLEIYCRQIDEYKENRPDGCDLAHRQKELEMEKEPA
jgi:hypothetical protein